MSGIRKCLLNIEKNFLFFLKRAGFFLRFFAYVDKKGGVCEIGNRLNQKKFTLKIRKNILLFQGTFIWDNSA
jgi:hypothetical protein